MKPPDLSTRGHRRRSPYATPPPPPLKPPLVRCDLPPHVPAAPPPPRRLLAAAPKHLAPPFFHSLSLPPPRRRQPASRPPPWPSSGTWPPPGPLPRCPYTTPPSASTWPPPPSAASASPRPSSTPPTASRPPPPPAAAATTHLCRVCSRRFRARDALLRHFEAIHTREHAKRLARIDSARGDRRVRLAAALSLKLSKYEKAARELTAAAAGPASPADDLSRAGVSVELSRTPAASLRERARQVLDEGSVGCLMLVSWHEELASLLQLARERGVRSVVVDGESGLARWADVGFTWAEVVAGKARKAAPSVSGKWRDRDVLQGLEWRYEEDDDEEEVVFQSSDGDGIEELAGNAKGRPW